MYKFKLQSYPDRENYVNHLEIPAIPKDEAAAPSLIASYGNKRSDLKLDPHDVDFVAEFGKALVFNKSGHKYYPKKDYKKISLRELFGNSTRSDLKERIKSIRLEDRTPSDYYYCQPNRKHHFITEEKIKELKEFFDNEVPHI